MTIILLKFKLWKKYKVDRLVKEDAVVEELVDVVVVDVQIVAEDLMTLKMQLLVVDAVMRLIEEDMDMDVGVGMGMGMGRVSNVDRQRLVDAFEGGDDYHELAALLAIPYQTARSIIRVSVGGRLCTKTTRRWSSQHQTDR